VKKNMVQSLTSLGGGLYEHCQVVFDPLLAYILTEFTRAEASVEFFITCCRVTGDYAFTAHQLLPCSILNRRNRAGKLSGTKRFDLKIRMLDLAPL
jgi:hypothetical protein